MGIAERGRRGTVERRRPARHHHSLANLCARAPSTRLCVVRVCARARAFVCVFASDRPPPPPPSLFHAVARAQVPGWMGGRRSQKPPAARYRGLAVGRAIAERRGPLHRGGPLRALRSRVRVSATRAQHSRRGITSRSRRCSVTRRWAAGRLCRRCSPDYFSPHFHSTLIYIFYTFIQISEHIFLSLLFL